MQKWLDNNDILIYSTHNGSKSVIAERFIKTLKHKIYKKITANDNKSYLPYLNRLADQYSNTYHIILVVKNLLVPIILVWLKKLKQIIKFLNLKLMIELKLLSIKIFLVSVVLKIDQEKYLLSISFWKLIKI